MDITPEKLFAEDLVVLGGDDGLTGAPMQGAVADAGQAHGVIELLMQVFLQRLVGELLHQLGDEIETHVAIHIFLLFQGALHDGVDDLLLVVVYKIEVFGHAHGVGFIDMVEEELLFRSVLVDQFRMEWNPRLHARLMGQDVDDLDGAFVGGVQEWEVVAHGLVYIEETVLIEFHEGQRGGEYLGERCDVVHILRHHLGATSVGEVAEALVIHHLAFVHGDDLAAGIGTFVDAHAGDGVELTFVFDIECAFRQRSLVD